MKRTDVVIYTCVTGGFDEVEAVPEDFPFRCILFTDNKSINVNGWEICLIDDKKKSPIHINRNLKIRMHPMIKEYKKSIYIDGNVIIKEESVELIDKLLKLDNEIGLNLHPRFNSVYEDLFEIFRVGIVKGYMMISVLRNCIDLGIKLSDPFYECNIIYRRHTEKIDLLMNDWWDFYSKGTGRDQAAFVMAVKKNNMKVLNIDLEDIRKKNSSYFFVKKHGKNKNFHKRLMVRFLSELTLTRIFFKYYMRKVN